MNFAIFAYSSPSPRPSMIPIATQHSHWPLMQLWTPSTNIVVSCTHWPPSLCESTTFSHVFEAGNPSVLVTKDDRTDDSVTYDESVDSEHGATYRTDVPVGEAKVTGTTTARSDETVTPGLKYGCCVSVAAGINQWPSILESDDGGWRYLDK